MALGALAGMLSAAGLVIQDRPVAEVFRLVGLRRTPLVTLMGDPVLLVSLAGGRQHPRGRPGRDARPGCRRYPADLTAAFENW